jgi:homospermidine synthase
MGRKIVLLGCGGVGKCTLYYLPKILRISYNQVYIVDKQLTPKSFPTVEKAIQKGAKYIYFTITAENIKNLLTRTIGCESGDLVIDLTTRTDCNAFLQVTRQLQLHYLCTSIEKANVELVDTIWMQHAKIRDIAEKTSHYGNATSCIEMGMNPGMISIFVKQGIIDIARYVLKHTTKKNKELAEYVKAKNYSKIGEVLGINTIHCSEIDTQKCNDNRKREFMNTWSCLGLVDEAFEHVEVSVGGHEKALPFKKKDIKEIVPGLVTITKPCSRTFFHSYLPIKKPDGAIECIKIKGAAIHHGESISLNKFLATDLWTPTIHYVYQMSPQTHKTVKAMTEKQLVNITHDARKWKVLNVHDDDLYGTDNVGATFLLGSNPITGEKKPWAWWCGTMLDTDYTQNVLKDPYFGPTTIQVVAGVLGGAKYIFAHPNKDLLFPEDIPETFILKHVKKYLGIVYSGPLTGCKITSTRMKHLAA